jgi:hypothetical protein
MMSSGCQEPEELEKAHRGQRIAEKAFTESFGYNKRGVTEMR